MELDMSVFRVGSRASVLRGSQLDAASILNMSGRTADRVAYNLRRCRELGLQCDEYGIPRISTDAEMAAEKRRRSSVDEMAAKLSTALAASRTSAATATLNRASPKPKRVAPSPMAEPSTKQDLDRVASLNLPESCLGCVRRVQLNDGQKGLSWGYCEGCQSLTRNCPSCHEDKPQTDWGYGFVEVTPGTNRAEWCCPVCRDRDETLSARFTVTLDLDMVSRHLLREEIRRAPGGISGMDIMPLVRLVAALQEGTGEIDIDLSDCDEVQRDNTTAVLSNVRIQVSPKARDAAERLYVAWVDQTWTDKRGGAAPRPLREAERSALTHGEKPIVSKTK
jgi:hypothetical protein